jgi:hypothetical protein
MPLDAAPEPPTGARDEIIKALDSVAATKSPRPRTKAVVGVSVSVVVLAGLAALGVGAMTAPPSDTASSAQLSASSPPPAPSAAGTAVPTPVRTVTRNGSARQPALNGGAVPTSTPGGRSASAGRTTRATPAHSASATTTPAAGLEIIGIGSGLCIDPAGSGSGAHLFLETCNGSARQEWTYPSDGTVRSEGLCMDVNNKGTSVGTLVVVNTCDGSGTQHFVLNSANDLTANGVGELCVETQNGGTAAGTPLQLQWCQGTVNQKWKKGST